MRGVLGKCELVWWAEFQLISSKFLFHPAILHTYHSSGLEPIRAESFDAWNHIPTAWLCSCHSSSSCRYWQFPFSGTCLSLHEGFLPGELCSAYRAVDLVPQGQPSTREGWTLLLWGLFYIRTGIQPQLLTAVTFISTCTLLDFSYLLSHLTLSTPCFWGITSQINYL